MKIVYPHGNAAWLEATFDVIDERFTAGAHAEALGALPGVSSWLVDDKMTLRLPRNVTTTKVWGAFIGQPEARLTMSESPPLAVPTALYESDLYEYQREGARFLIANDGGLIGDEPGLGKTRLAIAAMETIAHRDGYNRPRLILAPKYTRSVWLSELLKLNVIEHEDDFVFGQGRDTWDTTFNYDAKYWFVHFDVAYAWANRLLVTPRGSRGRPVVAVIDEIHHLRNPKTQRARGVATLAGVCPVRIGLTGTPLVNRPEDLWNVLTIVDGTRSWGSRLSFRQRYCGAYNDGEHWVNGECATNVDELRERLAARYLRRTVVSVGLDLPPLRRTTLTVDLDDLEKRTHATYVAQLGGTDELLRAVIEHRAGTRTLELIGMLRQLTSEAKLRTTIDYVNDILEGDGSVVVFVWQRATAVQIAKSLRAKDHPNVHVVHGGIAQDERDEAVREFQIHGGVLLATLDALKEGVTLTKAAFVVLHDLSWVPTDVLQAEKRIHRISQSRPCISTWVLANDSIDVLLAKVVAVKAKMMDEVLAIGEANDAVEELKLPAFLGVGRDRAFAHVFEALGVKEVRS